jgi:hypothetical protein
VPERRPRPLSPEQRLALLEHLRSDDPDADTRAFYRASRATGLHRRTVRRAWMDGAPPAQPPLREVVAAEKARARYRLSKEALRARVQEATVAMVEDGAKAREAEAMAARAAIGLAAGLLAQINAVAPAVESLVTEAIRSALASADRDRGLDVAARVVVLGRQVTEILAGAQAAERRALGEADLRVDVRSAPAPVLTTAEAEAELEAARRALRMVQEAEDAVIDDVLSTTAN